MNMQYSELLPQSQRNKGVQRVTEIGNIPSVMFRSPSQELQVVWVRKSCLNVSPFPSAPTTLGAVTRIYHKRLHNEWLLNVPSARIGKCIACV